MTYKFQHLSWSMIFYFIEDSYFASYSNYFKYSTVEFYQFELNNKASIVEPLH